MGMATAVAVEDFYRRRRHRHRHDDGPPQGVMLIHPERGVFLGVDAERKAVFELAASLSPDQPVPVFSDPDAVVFQACDDRAILECKMYVVPVSDVAGQTTRAGDVIENGVLKTERPISPTKCLFNSVAFAVERYIAPWLVSQPVRNYQAPPQP